MCSAHSWLSIYMFINLFLSRRWDIEIFRKFYHAELLNFLKSFMDSLRLDIWFVLVWRPELSCSFYNFPPTLVCFCFASGFVRQQLMSPSPPKNNLISPRDNAVHWALWMRMGRSKVQSLACPTQIFEIINMKILFLIQYLGRTGQGLALDPPILIPNI